VFQGYRFYQGGVRMCEIVVGFGVLIWGKCGGKGREGIVPHLLHPPYTFPFLFNPFAT